MRPRLHLSPPGSRSGLPPKASRLPWSGPSLPLYHRLGKTNPVTGVTCLCLHAERSIFCPLSTRTPPPHTHTQRSWVGLALLLNILRYPAWCWGSPSPALKAASLLHHACPFSQIRSSLKAMLLQPAFLRQVARGSWPSPVQPRTDLLRDSMDPLRVS